MLPTQMQQEKYHYCRTQDKRGFNLKMLVAMKKYNFQCESIHGGLNIHLLQMEGAVESKAGANWHRAGWERSSGGCWCVCYSQALLKCWD